MIVYKYDLHLGANPLSMPVGAQMLHVDVQDGKKRLWALVDELAEKERRWVYVAATGEPLGSGPELKHISTMFTHGLVFHAFESIQ